MDAVEITPEDSVAPIYLVPPTAEEIAEVERNNQLVQQFEQQATEQALARQTAIGKLESLGLTTEEITALIGGN